MLDSSLQHASPEKSSDYFLRGGVGCMSLMLNIDGARSRTAQPRFDRQWRDHTTTPFSGEYDGPFPSFMGRPNRREKFRHPHGLDLGSHWAGIGLVHVNKPH
jgi:hypothetical protein